jgi:hypothetical protein
MHAIPENQPDSPPLAAMAAGNRAAHAIELAACV